MESQSKHLLSKLMRGERLSSRDAVVNYGIQDLPKRISELRQCGYEIESAVISGINRHGRQTHWCEYWISETNRGEQCT